MYSYIKKSSYSFLETIDELRLAFSEIGFGVVSNIDVAEKIRAKIDPNFGKYVTL
jgi:uncharacterized protein (DUF302 family)